MSLKVDQVKICYQKVNDKMQVVPWQSMFTCFNTKAIKAQQLNAFLPAWFWSNRKKTLKNSTKSKTMITVAQHHDRDEWSVNDEGWKGGAVAKWSKALLHRE